MKAQKPQVRNNRLARQIKEQLPLIQVRVNLTENTSRNNCENGFHAKSRTDGTMDVVSNIVESLDLTYQGIAISSEQLKDVTLGARFAPGLFDSLVEQISALGMERGGVHVTFEVSKFIVGELTLADGTKTPSFTAYASAITDVQAAPSDLQGIEVTEDSLRMMLAGAQTQARTNRAAAINTRRQQMANQQAEVIASAPIDVLASLTK